MRFPFRDLGVSDAAKLGLKGQPVPVTGEVQYELLLQLADAHAFTTDGDFGPFTEVDSSGTYVAVAGGVCKARGNGAWNANGVYLTTKSAVNVPGAHRIKVTPLGATYPAMIGGQSGAFDIAGNQGVALLYASSAGLSNYGAASGVLQQALWSLSQQYEVEQRWNNETKEVSLSYRTAGGTWRKLGFIRVHTLGTTPATLGFQINMPQNTAQWEFDDYSRLSGYATDGPTLTYVADAGENKTFDGWVFANLAAVGSWATTNAKFKYSFDDGTPSYNASWLSLAELNGTAALTTRKRYARLMVQVNSDGATQQYAGEINADDATAGGGDYPEVGNVLVTDTVQAAAGTYAALPAVVDKFNPS